MFFDFLAHNRKPNDQRGYRKQVRARKLLVEALENRCLLSVNPVLAASAGFSGTMTYGAPVQLIATAQDAGTGTPVATGSIDFSNLTTGQDLGTVPLTPSPNGASAALPLSSLDVGSYSIDATYIDTNSQPEGTSGAIAVTVDPATPSVAVSDAGGGTDVYTGQPVVVAASATGVNNVGLGAPVLTYYAGAGTSTPLSNAPVDVGTYTVVASLSAAGDYTAGSAQATYSITPAAPNVSVVDAGGGTDVYTGQPVAIAASATDLNDVSLGTPTLAYYAGAGTSTPLPNAPVDVGTYTVVASLPAAGDYAAGSAQATYSITPAAPNVSVVDAGNGTDVYTGQPVAIAASATDLNNVSLGTPALTYYAGADTTGALLSQAPVDVGTYTVVASLPAAGDYAAGSAQATYSITAATPNVTVVDAGNGSDLYTGQPVAITASATDLNNVSLGTPVLTYYAGTDTSATPLTNAPVDVGTYTVVASLPAAGDYSAGSAQATYNITAAAPTVSVVDAGGGNDVYTGKPVVVTASATGLNNVSLGAPALSYYAGTTITTANLLTAAPVNVGTYTVVASVPAAGDYSAASAQATYNITAASSIVTVSDAGGVYTGKPTAVAASATGANNAHLTPTLTYYAGTTIATANLLTAAPVNVGTYTVVASVPAAGNYAAASAQATFSITPATPTVKVKDAGEVYNDKPTAVTASATGVNKVSLAAPVLTYYAGANTSGTPLTAAPVDIGTYTVVASVAAAGNYAGASAKATFKITAATPTVKVSDPGRVYTGNPTVVTASATGVNKASLAAPTLTYYAGTNTKGTPLTAAPVNVGTYTVVASVAAAGDYAAASAKATFKITAAAPSVTVSDPGGPYTGSPTVVAAAATGVNNVALAAPTLTYYAGASTKGKPLTAAPVNVGTYTVVASVAAAGNYAAASAKATFKITGATPTVTVSDAGGVYTGKATVVAAAATGLNNVSLGAPKLRYYAGTGTKGTPLSAAPVNVGTYTVVASVAAEGNYAAASAQVTFQITPATLTVTPNSVTKVYGQAVALSGTVTGIVNNEKLMVAYKSGGAAASALVENGPYAITATVTGATAKDYTVVVIPATVTVTPASTVVKLSIVPNPASNTLLAGETVTLKAAVAAVAPSTRTVPGGTVQYFDNGLLIATEGVWNGEADASLVLTAGAHDITAQYVANADYDASSPSNDVRFTV
jgi:hypothetical protein